MAHGWTIVLPAVAAGSGPGGWLMRMSKLVLAAAIVMGSGAVFADEPPLDVTMQVVDSPNGPPGQVTKTLVLPPAAAAAAGEQRSQGLDRANDARTEGRDFGQSISEEAKAQGKALGKGQGRGRGRP